MSTRIIKPVAAVAQAVAGLSMFTLMVFAGQDLRLGFRHE
jgi:hypothetical protein